MSHVNPLIKPSLFVNEILHILPSFEINPKTMKWNEKWLYLLLRRNIVDISILLIPKCLAENFMLGPTTSNHSSLVHWLSVPSYPASSHRKPALRHKRSKAPSSASLSFAASVYAWPRTLCIMTARALLSHEHGIFCNPVWLRCLRRVFL